VITEWFIWLGLTIAGWFVSLFPTGDPPAFIGTIDDQWNSITGAASGIGVWVDWTYVLVVFGVVLGVYVAMFIVKLVLKIAAFIPFFGGSG
jgi:hypothetical protein